MEEQFGLQMGRSGRRPLQNSSQERMEAGWEGQQRWERWADVECCKGGVEEGDAGGW